VAIPLLLRITWPKCVPRDIIYTCSCDETAVIVLTAVYETKFQSELISIEVFYKEVDIEASKPASSTPIRYDTMMSVTTAMTTTTARLLVSDTT